MTLGLGGGWAWWLSLGRDGTGGVPPTRELSMLEAIDPSIARSFNQPEMLALYEDVATQARL